MTTKIRVVWGKLELEVECEKEDAARKLIDDLTAKFQDIPSMKTKKLSK